MTPKFWKYLITNGVGSAIRFVAAEDREWAEKELEGDPRLLSYTAKPQFEFAVFRCPAEAVLRLDRVSKDDAETLNFGGAASNTNCALRTLRRMLHKAEEWNLINKVPKLKLLREHGRRLRLDDDVERKLIAAAESLGWRQRSFGLFRDIVILARDTGMRNRRELYRMRIENLDWKNRTIFVPDSKTPDGRRVVPMSDRVCELLRNRICKKREGWVLPSKRAKCGHLTDMAHQFRLAREKAGLPDDLVLYCGSTITELVFSAVQGTWRRL
jgi:integrase